MPQKKQIEIRHFPMELRVEGDENAPKLVGHIAVFNELSEDLGGFKEKIAPGAFTETIETQDIRALWNHENDLVLGRTSSGTLELKEDDTGLAFSNQPPDTTWFRDRLVSIKRKDVTGASFGFFTDSDEWSTEKDGTRVRTLKKVTLLEVSPGVTFPAYPQADVALRSMELWQEAEKKASGQTEAEAQCLYLKKKRLRLRELASK